MRWALLAVGPLVAGFLLDLLVGDPPCAWHPVRGMGALIVRLERALRAVLPDTPRGQLCGGALLALLTVGVSGGVCAGLLWLAARVSVWLWLALESLLCYFFLAGRGLRDAGMLVYTEGRRAGLPAAREALARIVGRDTAELDEEGVARAAVETVAENAADGVMAPLLYLALGGAVCGAAYKAVNTLDSMVGYRSERYRYFGRVSARLDDVCNWVPARLAALFLCGAAGLPGYRAGDAWRVWRRDRRKHPSPNSAQCESACAGALGVRLGGESRYGGKLSCKPVLGAEFGPAGMEDIPRAGRLMLVASAAFWLVACGVRLGVLWALWCKAGGV